MTLLARNGGMLPDERKTGTVVGELRPGHRSEAGGDVTAGARTRKAASMRIAMTGHAVVMGKRSELRERELALGSPAGYVALPAADLRMLSGQRILGLRMVELHGRRPLRRDVTLIARPTK